MSEKLNDHELTVLLEMDKGTFKFVPVSLLIHKSQGTVQKIVKKLHELKLCENTTGEKGGGKTSGWRTTPAGKKVLHEQHYQHGNGNGNHQGTSVSLMAHPKLRRTKEAIRKLGPQ